MGDNKIVVLCNNCAAVITYVDVQELKNGKRRCPYCKHILKIKEGEKIAKPTT
jgi:hypothetical protein